MEAPWGSPTVSFTSGLPRGLNFPGWAWAQTGTGGVHSRSWMKLATSMREAAVPCPPHLLTSGQVSQPHPRKGVSLHHCQVKSTEPRSLGNAAQRCDSVGVLSLTGMGTSVSPGEPLCFQGPAPSTDAPPPACPSGGARAATASSSESNARWANRTSSTT